MEIFGKTAIFPGGFGRIGEVPHGRIWPDWGLTIVEYIEPDEVLRKLNFIFKTFYLY